MGKVVWIEAQKSIEEWTANKPDDMGLPNKKALLLALKGDYGAAEAAIPGILSRHPAKDPLYHHAAYDIACIYALEGKSAEAVKWLRETRCYRVSMLSLVRARCLFEQNQTSARIYPVHDGDESAE